MCHTETMERVTYADLIEKVLDDENIERALKQVVGNRGSPGIDGMTVLELRATLPARIDSIKESIRAGKYKPQPVKRVEIPKPDGGVRMLGIPTATDRLVQQMVAQVLIPIYDPTFSDSSFGFRPGRSPQDAILRVRDLYDEGYIVAVSIDLAKYFDVIPQDLLMNVLRETIKDDLVIQLVKRFLKSGTVLNDGLRITSDKGTPQGGPLSPLLSNIYLDRFDKELERRGLHFVRFADDAQIFVRTPRAAERVMESCSEFLEKRMKLKVNREKSSIGSPMELKYLGFRLYRMKDGTTGIYIHEKSLKRFKARIREITRRYRGRRLGDVITELRRFMRGWVNYFGLCNSIHLLNELDEWIRHRVRVYIFNQWKTPKNRIKQMRKIRGTAPGSSMDKRIRALAYTRHIWRATGQITLNVILRNDVLRKKGMYFMSDDWVRVQERCLRSPLRVRTVGSVGGRQTTLFDF